MAHVSADKHLDAKGHKSPVIALSPPTSSAQQDIIILNVSGRIFSTLRSTLEESTFLSTLVSERWEHSRLADGSYFVDGNPDTFRDVLDYLQRGWMPLFWTLNTGHDFVRYKKLEQEADYFGIPRLRQWLQQQKFKEAITNTDLQPFGGVFEKLNNLRVQARVNLPLVHMVKINADTLRPQ